MNKIVKIALVASAMLAMSFTTGCYEVINKIKDICCSPKPKQECTKFQEGKNGN